MVKKLHRPKPGSLRHKKNGWKVHFSFGGTQYKKYAGTDDGTACILQSRVNSLITEIKCGLTDVPSDTSIRDFIFSQVIKKPDPEEIVEHTTHLSELITTYLENPPSKAPNTLKTEKIHLGHLRKFLQYKNFDPALKDVSVSFFNDYKKNRKKNGVANSTINKEIITFKRLFALAVEKELIKINVVLNVTKEKKELRERFRTTEQMKDALERGSDYSEKREKAIKRYRYLNGEEIATLIELTKEQLGEEHWLVPIVITLSYTGMRRGELIALEWGDIDFDNNLIYVKSRKQSKTQEYQGREIDINTQLLPILEKQKANVKEAWVFPGPNGGQLSAHSLRSALLRVIKGTDFEGIGFHCLRHSFASILAKEGVDSRIIADLMGHTSQEMVELYRHLFPPDRKRALAKLHYRIEKIVL